MRTKRTQNMVRVSLFAVLIAVCAWICVPTAVPFTMQTFGVFVTLSILGGKLGTAAIGVYLLMGAVGVPVFSGGTGGIGVLLGATGGYLLGLLLLGLTVWAMEALFRKRTWILALSLVLGLTVCYAVGTTWFMMVYARHTGTIGLGTALGMCVAPFLIPDVVKLACALVVSKRLRGIMHKI